MATIKSYTDISQSKKLAEILPLESADMYWWSSGKRYYIEAIDDGDFNEEDGHIRAWSLAALLDVLKHPRCFQGDKPIYWFCGCFGKDNLYHEVEADNPVDACYEMIIRLSKNELI